MIVDNEIGPHWTGFSRLAEVGGTMPLPRRSEPPRNVGPNPFSDNSDQDDTPAQWDTLDYLVVAGALLFLIGVLCALFERTRPGGILVPVGAALCAAAGFAARRSDTPERDA
jgi:hypothetical protein